MESKEHKLLDFKVGELKDNYGNTACSATFEGVSEPVTWMVKDPTKVAVGQSYYGHTEDATSRAGKPYRRFYRDQRPEASDSTPSKSFGYVKDDKEIRALAIMKSAAEYCGRRGMEAADIPTVAQVLLETVEALKAGVSNPAEVQPEQVSAEDIDKPIDMSEIPFQGVRHD